jgi:hypothetical protein
MATGGGHSPARGAGHADADDRREFILTKSGYLTSRRRLQGVLERLNTNGRAQGGLRSNRGNTKHALCRADLAQIEIRMV